MSWGCSSTSSSPTGSAAWFNPTILVAGGRTRWWSARRSPRSRTNVLDSDNNSVAGPPVEYEAPFGLEINEVDINRLNNTVKLDVVLTDTRFSETLANVNELSDRTSDVIDTTPGRPRAT